MDNAGRPGRKASRAECAMINAMTNV